jgi:hypothetical protein
MLNFQVSYKPHSQIMELVNNQSPVNTANHLAPPFDDMLLIALRMTFGGSPCPSLWGIISETLADISNSILQNKYWDYTNLHDPISDTLDSPPSLPDTIPFHHAHKLAVTLPNNDQGQVNIFIGDTIGITPD